MNNVPSDLNVLIIDDSPGIRRAAQKFLEETKINVFTASTSLEGLSLICDIAPRFILIDASMPELDGYQFSFLVRSFRPDLEIKLILLEMKSNHIDVEKYNAQNFFAQLLKPFTREELLSILLDDNQSVSNKNQLLKSPKTDY